MKQVKEYWVIELIRSFFKRFMRFVLKGKKMSKLKNFF